jgi:hypothetical protein
VRELCLTRRRRRKVVSICHLSVPTTVPLNRNVLMKRAAIGLISTAMIAVAAPAAPATANAAASGASHKAPASTTQSHRCRPSQPSFTSLLATPTVSCRQARALNTYMTRHETLAGRFVLNGETWFGTVSARAENETEMVYRNGVQTVWITYGGPAS